MFLERQPPNTRTCARHALNNMLQNSVASYKDFEDIYKSYSRQESMRSYYSSNLASSTIGVPHEGNNKLDNWSLTIPLQWLTNHGYNYTLLQNVTSFGHASFKNGRFLIYAHVGVHNSHHAVSVVNKLLLDSLKNSPIPISSDLDALYRIQKVWILQLKK